MKRIAVLGAGLGGTIMAYEIRDRVGQGVDIRHADQQGVNLFLRSVKSVGCGRLARTRQAVEVDLRARLRQAQHRPAQPQGAERLVHPEENRIQLMDGSSRRTTTIW